jgi:uncharacterized membrane protein YhaH (DUF805 family)
LSLFFFSLAKAKRPACGRQAQRNLRVSRLLLLVSWFLFLVSCLFSLFFFCSQRRRDAKKSNGQQSLASCLLVLVSCLLSFFARKGAEPQRNLIANESYYLLLDTSYLILIFVHCTSYLVLGTILSQTNTN